MLKIRCVKKLLVQISTLGCMLIIRGPYIALKKDYNKLHALAVLNVEICQIFA